MRLIVATWVDQAMKDMMMQRSMVRNAWLKQVYEWLDKNDGGVELIGGEEGLI